MYANALAQMLSDKNISGASSSSHSDIITLPQNRSAVATTTMQQPPNSSEVTELKQSSDAQLKSLLAQSSPSQQARVQSTDLLTSALQRSHSPNHPLTISTSTAGTSPKPNSAISQDLHSSSSPAPQLPAQNQDLQAASSLAGLSADKIGEREDVKQKLSPYHNPMMPSDQQLSPSTTALGITNLSNQKSPSRQLGGKDEASLAVGMATGAIPGKEEYMLTEDTKLFLRQLAQQHHLPQQQQQQKSMQGSFVLPPAGSSDQEEITIHPGGSGELVMTS